MTAPTRELNYEDLFGDLADAVRSIDGFTDYRPYGENTDFLVTVYDRTYKPVGEAGDRISLAWDSPRNKVETATMVLKGDDPLNEHMMMCYEQVIPVTVAVNDDPANRVWAGRVDTFDDAIVNGENTVTYQLLGDYNWSNKLLTWPNFAAPIQAQFPHDAVYIGPAVSCALVMFEETTFRLQSGIWELINNITNPQAWFGTLEMGQDLLTPLAVNLVDPLFDTSKWVSFHGRMDNANTLLEPILKDNGLILTFDLWLPGEPQPLNDFAGLGGFVQLKAPTIVINIKDRSGITGPTGTFVDGALFDLLDLQDGILGDVLKPFLDPSNEYAPEGVVIAPELGVNFVAPWAIFTDHPRGGIKELHFNGHHPLAYTVVGGGKSPKWMNDLVNATLEYLLDALMIVIGFTGIPSNILDGVFDDVLLAFQEVENFDRRVALGPYGYPEYFVSTGSSAYTFDEYLALRSAMWDTRGYHSAQITVDNGYPYTLGKDIFKGQLASLVRRGKVYTDYIDQVSGREDRNTSASITYTIGDGKAQESPVAKLQRRIAGFEAFINIVTLSAN